MGIEATAGEGWHGGEGGPNRELFDGLAPVRFARRASGAAGIVEKPPLGRMKELATGSAAVLALACGPAQSSSHHPPVSSELASAPAQGSGHTQCADEQPYDAERGCRLDTWGVSLEVHHENQMGGGFRLVGAAYGLDGDRLFESNDVALLGRRSFPVLTTGVSSAEHELSVLLIYRGHGAGVFEYLNDYRFRARAEHVFDARGERLVELRAVGYERGGATTPLEERPAIRFEKR